MSEIYTIHPLIDESCHLRIFQQQPPHHHHLSVDYHLRLLPILCHHPLAPLSNNQPIQLAVPVLGLGVGVGAFGIATAVL